MAINWQDVIVTFVTTVGGGGVLLGTAAYLIKTALTHRLAQETETFKTRLKADADAQIERLKLSLQITALEHQIRFSKLHERRAEIIAELYKRLGEVHEDGTQFVIISRALSSRHEQFEYFDKVTKPIAGFIRFVDTHRIYIPARACELLDKYIHTLHKAVADVGVYQIIEDPTPQMVQEKTETFRNAYMTVMEDVPKLKQALETEFRTMLGETQESKAN